ncbi:PLC-like phosphodiesterase, partial [Microstroma glucosiphilum]
ATLVSRATVCNGHDSLCSRKYSNVTYIGTHNSYAIASGTSNVAANQQVSITTQLNSGVRMLQSQAHNSTNATITGAGIDLCHTSCDLFQGGAIEYWLTQIKTWVDANPNDVLSLLIVNSDDLPPTRFAEAFESTGLVSKMYAPTSSSLSRSSWPTLGDLIDAGTTVIAYMDNSANVSSVPYLLPEFSAMWENPYDQLSTPFNCSVDRIGSGLKSNNLMYLANSFLDEGVASILVTPDTDALYTTNSESSVLSEANNCASEHTYYPNFVLVDYYNIPENDVFAAAAQMNGVNFTNTTTSSTSGSSGSSSSGSS